MVSTHDQIIDADWWKQAVVYQIYPRSFADANGDGIGDLAGIISQVGYLAELGIDAVWISPFYPSALADGGYDIDDYRDVDPTIGTLAQFDELVAALRRRGIRVFVDIVPNHCSDRHAWFLEALAAPCGSPARDRFIFRDGRGPDGSEPPSDWSSFFGGPAWSRTADGQWYLHLFTKQQPDWNWSNDEVRGDFLRTLRFWGDRGVAGFRVDVAHLMAKDLPEELPTWMDLVKGMGGRPGSVYQIGQHPIFDRDELGEIYAEWRDVFSDYKPPLVAVAEAWVAPERRVLYSRYLGQAFNFDLLKAKWDHAEFQGIIANNLSMARDGNTSSTWVFSNHDLVRHATRYGLPAETDAKAWLLSGGEGVVEDVALGLRRARAVTLLAMALPGSMYIYQGEELGLREVATIPADRKQDPMFFRNPSVEPGRDGCRVPLPWIADAPAFGFSTGKSHLPQPRWFDDYAVDAEEADPESTLQFYRRAIKLRRELAVDQEFNWLGRGDHVLAFSRSNGWVSLTNFGSAPADLPEGTILLTSDGSTGSRTLAPDTTVWMRTGRDRTPGGLA